MTDDTVIVSHGSDRRHRRCLCAECGIIAICTPSSDFFTKGPLEPISGDPIFCYDCFLIYVNNRIISYEHN